MAKRRGSLTKNSVEKPQKTDSATKVTSLKDGKSGVSKKSRSYQLSPEAFAIVEQVAAQNRFLASVFVSECICACGPSLLKEKFAQQTSSPSYGARLDYLEDILLKDAYKSLVALLKASKAIKAHQRILREFDTVPWHGDIKELVDAAVDYEKTEKTPPASWRTLLRNKEQFLTLKPKKKTKENT